MIRPFGRKSCVEHRVDRALRVDSRQRRLCRHMRHHVRFPHSPSLQMQLLDRFPGNWRHRTSPSHAPSANRSGHQVPRPGGISRNRNRVQLRVIGWPPNRVPSRLVISVASRPAATLCLSAPRHDQTSCLRRAGGAQCGSQAPLGAIPGVKGGEKPDQRVEQNTATAAVGVRWSEEVGMRPGAVSAGNEGRRA